MITKKKIGKCPVFFWVGATKPKKYSESGEYVFHGSPNGGIEVLEPKQAYVTIKGEKIKDGKPAVFASKDYNLSLVHAVLGNSVLWKEGSGFRTSVSNGIVKVWITREMSELLENNNPIGCIYVLKKENFSKSSRDEEVVSRDVVVPVEKIKVGKEELLKSVSMNFFENIKSE